MSLRSIAIVFEYQTLNGGERSMLAVIDQLKLDQSEFEFIAIGQPSGLLAESLVARAIPLIPWSIHSSAGDRRSSTEIDESLYQALASSQADLVHGNSLSMGRLLGRISGRLKIPTSAHLRDIIKLSRAAVDDLNRNQKLVAVSYATRDAHLRQGLDRDKTVVIHNGIDLDRFQPRPRSGWLIAELRNHRHGQADRNLPEVTSTDNRTTTPKLIACIGQIGLRKGQDVLAKAVPLIVEQVPQAEFLLIGERNSQKAESIRFEQDIYQQFADARLSSRLHRLGNRNDVAEILSEIELLIHPANQEPFGRVLLEATAAGVPIVATNVGGTSEIIENHLTGRLVPAGDFHALAEAAISVLNDDTESSRMRKSARLRAEAKFSIKTAANQLTEFWNELLD